MDDLRSFLSRKHEGPCPNDKFWDTIEEEGLGGSAHCGVIEPRSLRIHAMQLGLHPAMSDSPHTPARVLVVDDEAPICRVVTRILESRGFIAESVSSPEAVTRTVRDGNFDVVLLDRSMVKQENGDLVADLRLASPRAKIIYFTGELVSAVEQQSVDGVIQKPVNGKTLAETLRRVLDS
jgi:CheY-like chemotaxis protein